MSYWQHQELRQLLLAAEQQALAPVLAKIPGEVAVQVGELRAPELLAATTIPHQFTMGVDFEALATSLPLSPNSIDLIVAPHILEVGEDRARTLVESYQALVPGGVVVLLGFNSHGCWRCGAARCCSLSRSKRYLQRANFTILEQHKFLYHPPFCRKRWLEKITRVLFPWGAGLYMIVAEKTALCITPLRNEKKRRHLVAAHPHVEPTTRGV